MGKRLLAGVIVQDGQVVLQQLQHQVAIFLNQLLILVQLAYNSGEEHLPLLQFHVDLLDLLHNNYIDYLHRYLADKT